MKDKERKELEELVRKAVWDALTVTMTLEKRRDEKTGVPLAHPEIKKEEVFLPSFIVQLLGFNEGAFRGLQADCGKAINTVKELSVGLEQVVKGQEALAGVLLALEDFCKKYPELITLPTEVKLIEKGESDAIGQ